MELLRKLYLSLNLPGLFCGIVLESPAIIDWIFWGNVCVVIVGRSCCSQRKDCNSPGGIPDAVAGVRSALGLSLL